MKSVILFIFFLFTFNLKCEVTPIEGNKINKFLSVNSKWSNKEKEAFTPISNVQVLNGTVWVKTYRADYFPAKVNIKNGKVYLHNIIFRKRLPVYASDDPALLVEKYNNHNVSYILTLESCESQNEIKVEIFKGMKLMETICFEKNIREDNQ